MLLLLRPEDEKALGGKYQHLDKLHRKFFDQSVKAPMLKVELVATEAYEKLIPKFKTEADNENMWNGYYFGNKDFMSKPRMTEKSLVD